MKKSVSIILTLIMIISMLAFGTLSVSAATEGIYTYSISNGSATIVDCDASVSGALTIPGTIGGYPVKSIGGSAFYNCKSLTRVTIPSGVTNIGNSAFVNCSSLISIVVPDSLRSIDIGAFYNCYNLKHVYYPGNKDDWEYITIGDDNSYLENATFHYDYLESAPIPTPVPVAVIHYEVSETVVAPGNTFTIKVTMTGPEGEAFFASSASWKMNFDREVFSFNGDVNRAWAATSNLNASNGAKFSAMNVTVDADTVIADIEVTVDEDALPSKYEIVTEDAKANREYIVADPATIIIDVPLAYRNLYYEILNEEAIIIGSLPNTEIIEIPSEIKGYPVTGIANSAFYDCAELASVTIPDSVTSIGDRAFGGCSGLVEINVDPLNETYSSADGVLFNKNKTTLLYYPDGKSGSYTIPHGVTTIDEGAFLGCAELTDITVQSFIDVAWDSVFEDCINLEAVTAVIPDDVTSIPDGAFGGCSKLTSITIPDNITSIGDNAFEFCTGLTEITIPDSVISIGISAFEGCTGIASATISESTSFGENAFKGCTALASITAIYSSSSIKLSSIVDACVNLEDLTIIIPDGVTSIGESSFSGSSKITSIIIPDSVTSIGDNAFGRCSKLVSITLPAGITSIGEDVFYDCINLADVTIPDGVTSIGDSAFYNCKGLTNITIPDSVTSIGYMAFAYCGSLKGITVPDSVISIGASAFSGCNSIEELTIPFVGSSVGNGDSTSNLGYIFGGNNSKVPSTLKKVTVTNETLIADSAFKGCNSLTEIVIEDSVKGISPNAFGNIENFLNVTIKSRDVRFANSTVFSGSYFVTLYGYKGSAVEEYANNKEIEFIALDADKGPYVLDGSLKLINNKIVVNVKLNQKVTEERLHLVVHSADNRLLDYIIVPSDTPYDNMNVVFKDVPDAACVKAFLWASDSPTPLSDYLQFDIVR